MKNAFPHFLTALTLCFVAISPAQSEVQECSGGAMSPMLVTTTVLEAKITEAEANPDLEAGAKDKLISRYREICTWTRASGRAWYERSLDDGHRNV